MLAWVIALELLGIAIVLIILGHGKIQQELSQEIPQVMVTTGAPIPCGPASRHVPVFRACELSCNKTVTSLWQT